MPLHATAAASNDSSPQLPIMETGRQDDVRRVDNRRSTLVRLPPEIQENVLLNLVTDDPQETVSNLNRFKRTCKANEQLFNSPSKLGRIYSHLTRASEIAAELSDSLCDVRRSRLSGDLIGAHGWLLGLLPSRRRGELVRAALALEDPDEKAFAIAGLAIGLRYLKREQRTALVKATLDIADSGARACAIGLPPTGDYMTVPATGLGFSLGYLTVQERKALVRTVRRTEDPSHRAMGIAALAPGFKHLEPEQVQNLVRMIYDPQHPRALGRGPASKAIWGLGPGLKHIARDQRRELLAVVCDRTHPYAPLDDLDKAKAMSAFGSVLAHISPAERTDIFNMIADPNHPNGLANSDCRAIVMAACGAGISHFTADEQRTLLDMMIVPVGDAPETDRAFRSKAVSGIGPGLRYLPTKARHELMKRFLRSEQTNTLIRSGEAIGGMGMGLRALNVRYGKSLVRAALACEERQKAIAIAGLGQSADFLEEGDFLELVKGAQALPSTRFEVEPGSFEQDSRSMAIQGVAKGLENWTAKVLALERGRTLQKTFSSARRPDDRARQDFCR
ncbi:hypothetical protein [Rhizobium sp. NLR22b]|uniref:hypothetical protein n=1 Tax=Rhizobium sp. NLR22b TaxID=2731115 RepID=UPI001C83AB18|nr:hypothetical protein [Rhizobium sp. NLR22b]MBX5242039.1 hypothetical protein [Rhizobium sp. NLR22b]